MHDFKTFRTCIIIYISIIFFVDQQQRLNDGNGNIYEVYVSMYKGIIFFIFHAVRT